MLDFLRHSTPPRVAPPTCGVSFIHLPEGDPDDAMLACALRLSIGWNLLPVFAPDGLDGEIAKLRAALANAETVYTIPG